MTDEKQKRTLPHPSSSSSSSSSPSSLHENDEKQKQTLQISSSNAPPLASQSHPQSRPPLSNSLPPLSNRTTKQSKVNSTREEEEDSSDESDEDESDEEESDQEESDDESDEDESSQSVRDEDKKTKNDEKTNIKEKQNKGKRGKDPSGEERSLPQPPKDHRGHSQDKQNQLDPYPKFEQANFEPTGKWKDTDKTLSDIKRQAEEAFEKMKYWRRNLWKTPGGKVGQLIIKEMTFLITN